MAQPRRRYFSTKIRPLPADFEPRAKESMLYSILPSAVHSRLPRLPSLRRSASMYGLATPQKSNDSISGTSPPSSGTSTPRPGYMNAMVLSSVVDDIAGCSTESVSSDEEASRTGMKQRDSMEVVEPQSGISWKFAKQGFNLLSHSVEESTSISEESRLGNALFVRQLYLHAVTYLLRALPADLSIEEQLSLRSSLPPGIEENARYNNHKYSDEPPSMNEPPSILHRTLASTIVQLFILFQLVLPYLKTFLAAAYQYERKHRISEKIFTQSLDTVDSIGKTGLTVTGAVYGLNDGKVGQAITEAAAWFVEGVTGGIHEGIGEGMIILGAKPFQGQGHK